MVHDHMEGNTIALSDTESVVAKSLLRSIKDKYTNRQYNECLALCNKLMHDFRARLNYFITIDKFSKEDLSELQVTTRTNLLDVVTNGRTFSGLSLIALDKNAAAEGEFKELLKLGKKFNIPKTQLYALGNLGLVLTQQGRSEQALEFNEETIKLCRTQGWNLELSQSLGSTGVSYYKMGKFEDAINKFDEMLIIAKDKFIDYEVMAYNYKGVVYVKKEELENALNCFLEAEKKIDKVIDYQTRRDLLGNLGEIFVKTQKLEQSIVYFEKQAAEAQKLKDSLTISQAKLNCGLVYLMQEDYKSGIDAFNNCAQVSQSLIDSKFPAISVDEFAAIDKYTEYIIHAYTYMSMAYVKQSEKLQDVNFQKSAQMEALLAAEKAKQATALVQYLDKKQGRRVETLDFLSLFQFATRTQQTIIVYQYMNETLHSKWHAFSEQQFIYCYVIKPLPLNSDISWMNDSEMVDFAFNSELFAFNKVKIEENLQELLQHLTTSKDINDIELHKDEAMAARRFKTNLYKLYSWLIAPIQNHLPQDRNGKTLFIPHHVLYLVPFACLVDIHGEYLIEKCQVSVVPSIRLYELMEHKHSVAVQNNYERFISSSKEPCLLVGNPSIVNHQTLTDVPALPPMLNAEAEVNKISELIAQPPLIGSFADKETVQKRLAEDPKLIHLATHFAFYEKQDDESELSGAFVLTTSKKVKSKEEYYLYAKEIFHMNLNCTELAVLSACETMKGAFTVSGIAGLYLAFFAAGVPCIVQSLWPLHDRITQSFIEAFYNYLVKEQITVSQALRKAMLQQISEQQLPQYWGAFVCMGFCDGVLDMLSLESAKPLVEPSNLNDLKIKFKTSIRKTHWTPIYRHLIIREKDLQILQKYIASHSSKSGLLDDWIIHNSITSLNNSVMEQDLIVAFELNKSDCSVLQGINNELKHQKNCLVIACGECMREEPKWNLKNYCAYFGVDTLGYANLVSLQQFWMTFIELLVSDTNLTLSKIENLFRIRLKSQFIEALVQEWFKLEAPLEYYYLGHSTKIAEDENSTQLLQKLFYNLQLDGAVLSRFGNPSPSLFASSNSSQTIDNVPAPVKLQSKPSEHSSSLLPKEERLKLKISEPISFRYKAKRAFHKNLLQSFVKCITPEEMSKFICPKVKMEENITLSRLEMNQDFLTAIYMHDAELNEMIEQFPNEETHSFALGLELDSVDPNANRFKVRMENQQPDGADIYLCLLFVNLTRQSCTCIYPSTKTALTVENDFKRMFHKQYVELQIQLNARHVGTMQYVIFAASNIAAIPKFFKFMYENSKNDTIVDDLTQQSKELGVAMHIHQFDVSIKQ